tara:strand:+ start:255 stop:725 length:471 start_codon:yes stop_codon:yes gene_type:complete
MHRNKGYTLFELVLVMAIISVLFTLATVSFLPLKSKVDNKKMIESIIQHVAYAQELALTENKYSFLISNPDNQTYKLLIKQPSHGGLRRTALWYENSIVDEDIDISNYTNTLRFGDSDTIIFNPWGLLDSSDDIIIETDENNLIVSGVTGNVSIQN